MAVINVDDIYILGETGAQVDKVTGLFTKNENTTNHEKAFAQLNIGTAGSNRNLLDNPWWGSGEVVNQRNTQSKPSNGSYTIDRWILTSGVDANQWAIGANGITFTIASSSIWYTQRTPNPSAWSGKTLTASVLLSDGTIKSGSAAFTYGTAATFYNDSALNLSMNAQGQFVLAIRATQTIRAVKLEIGSVSTLANDAPPDYGEELRKCQYYFRRVQGDVYLCIGMVINATSVVFPFPFTMYKNPSVTISGNIMVASTGGLLTMTAVQSVGRATNAIQVRFTTSGATAYSAALLTPQNGGYIDFSAEP